MKQTSRTQFACLSALRVMPMSGYQIVESCKSWFGHFWSESYGQIYPALKKLEATGDIEKLPPQANQRGNVFKITQKGEETFKAWLHTPAMPPSLRDEYFLKFFGAGAVPTSVHLEHLQRKRQQLKADLIDTENSLAHVEKILHPDKSYWKLMIECGAIAYEAELAWLDKAEAFLKGHQKNDE